MIMTKFCKDMLEAGELAELGAVCTESEEALRHDTRLCCTLLQAGSRN